jgi:hypothetical protein
MPPTLPPVHWQLISVDRHLTALAGNLFRVNAHDVVDYALQRRARLREYATGRVSAAELCDAHPHLLLAARHYGEPVAHSCPLCQREALRYVHYVYGDQLGQVAGQAKSTRELAQLSQRFPRFTVYRVEVCTHCRWNHLARSFVVSNEDRPPAVAGG